MAIQYAFGRTNLLLGMVFLSMSSWRLALVLGFIVPDNLLGSVGVSRRHEDADFEDVRQPGLALSVQLAECPGPEGLF